MSHILLGYFPLEFSGTYFQGYNSDKSYDHGEAVPFLRMKQIVCVFCIPVPETTLNVRMQAGERPYPGALVSSLSYPIGPSG